MAAPPDRSIMPASSIFAMPEALAVAAVLVVALAAWVGAWLHARNPANFNARDEADRLRAQAEWIERRLAVAERERWGKDMTETLLLERAEVARQLAELEMRSA